MTQQRQRPKRRHARCACCPGPRGIIRDPLADGPTFRVLSIVDLYTRECVGLVPAAYAQMTSWRRSAGCGTSAAAGRQRQRVRVRGTRPLGLLEPGPVGPPSPRSADRQHRHRELPPQLSTRASRSMTLSISPTLSGASSRSIGIQQRPTPQWLRQHATGPLVLETVANMRPSNTIVRIRSSWTRREEFCSSRTISLHLRQREHIVGIY